MDDWLIFGAMAAAAGIAIVVLVLAVRRWKAAEATSSPNGPQAGPQPHALTPASLRQEFGRPAFLPETAPGDERPSHYGGRPWLGDGEEWPRCGCGQALQLLLQLDLDDLPDGAPPQRSGGLAQLFLCTTADCTAEDAPSNGRAVTARIIDPTTGGAQAAEDLAPNPPPPHAITGWRREEDLPTWSELLHLDTALTSEVEQYLSSGEHTLPGDKLGGWPLWDEAVEYPPCPECGEPMEFVFQLDSGGRLAMPPLARRPGYLMRCRTHSRRLEFHWARRDGPASDSHGIEAPGRASTR